MKKLEDYITTIPDFPEKGIMFRDITSLIEDAEGFSLAVDMLSEELKGIEFDKILGLESRGFIFGAPLSVMLKKGFVPVRKKGKLPRETVSQKYTLEYGEAEIEIHRDSLKSGDRVVIVDDLIATGGTLEASVKLVSQLGASVAAVISVIELKGLKGRDKLSGLKVISLIQYEGK